MKLKIMIMALLLVSAVGIGSATNYLPATTMYGDLDFSDGYYARNATEGIFNAKDYGAVGDGITDDISRLQACMDDIPSTGGTMYIPDGDFVTTTSLNGKSNISIIFSAGAKLNYSGSGDALTFYDPVRGDVREFSIIRPTISAPSGTCINLSGFWRCTVFEPYLDGNIGIDLKNGNSARIIGGGRIVKAGTARTSGSVGIKMADTSADVADVSIDVTNIKFFESGIQLGPDDYSQRATDIRIRSTFEGNKYGILIYTGLDHHVDGCYFESQTTSDILINNSGTLIPDELHIHGTYFGGGETQAIYSEDYHNGIYIWGKPHRGTYTYGDHTYAGFVVDKTRDFGIRTFDPTAYLHIYTITDKTDESEGIPLRIGSSTIGKMQMYFGVNNAGHYTYIGSVNTSTEYRSLVLQPSSSSKATVGIGTTAAAAKVAIDGGLNVGADNDPGDNNVYVVGDCSALTFTDRTPGYVGDALAEIRKIRTDDSGNIDHSTLPEFTKTTYRSPVYENYTVYREVNVTGKHGQNIKATIPVVEQRSSNFTVEPGRNMGNMISLQTVAIQQLIEINERQDAQIEAMQAEIAALKGSAS